ncbi:hypothetical protein [Pseudomonas sp. NPDC089396]|uniref:hypothetical protein n=1 Tax=Pseudomonas sp. NPDC089396 TaxID=3364461 RepID=UPI003836DBE9
MFTTDRFFTKIGAAWFLIVMLSVFIAGAGPKLLAIPAVAAVIAMTVWCIECAYRTERFVNYANLRMFFNLAYSPLFATMVTLMLTYKKMKLNALTSLVMGLAPLVLALLAYTLAYYWPGKSSALQFQGIRVESNEPAQAVQWWQAGASAGLGSVAYPLMKSHGVPMTGLIYVFVFLSLFMIFYHRDNITALRKLKAREMREKRRFTFMDIERIQAMRAESWLGRLFAIRGRRGS